MIASRPTPRRRPRQPLPIEVVPLADQVEISDHAARLLARMLLRSVDREQSNNPDPRAEAAAAPDHFKDPLWRNGVMQ